MKAALEAGVGSDVSAEWVTKLTGDGPNASGEALLDWLRPPAKGFGSRALRDMQMRIDELRSLGAERIVLPAVWIERMRQHAVRIAGRKAATLPRHGEPRRTVEIGCGLRLQLLAREPHRKQLTLDLAASAFLGLPLGPEADRINRPSATRSRRRSAPSADRCRLPRERGMAGRRYLVELFRGEVARRRHGGGEDLFSQICRQRTRTARRSTTGRSPTT